MYILFLFFFLLFFILRGEIVIDTDLKQLVYNLLGVIILQ